MRKTINTTERIHAVLTQRAKNKGVTINNLILDLLGEEPEPEQKSPVEFLMNLAVGQEVRLPFVGTKEQRAFTRALNELQKKTGRFYTRNKTSVDWIIRRIE